MQGLTNFHSEQCQPPSQPQPSWLQRVFEPKLKNQELIFSFWSTKGGSRMDICVSRSSRWILLRLIDLPEASTASGFCKITVQEHWTSSSSFAPLFCCEEYWRSVITWSRGRSGWGTESQDPALCGLGSFQRIFFHRRDCREGLINSPQADSCLSCTVSKGSEEWAVRFSTVLGIHSIFLLKLWTVWLSPHYCSLNFPLWLNYMNLYFLKDTTRH